MTLAAATITALTRRWGETYLAQLTRRDTYIRDDVTYSTIDEDVLERAVVQAQQYVQTRIGVVDEDHWGVIDIAIYTLLAPGQEEVASSQIDRVLALLRSNPVASATDAVAKGSDDDKRRFDGEDYEDLLDSQSRGRARRGTF